MVVVTIIYFECARTQRAANIFVEVYRLVIILLFRTNSVSNAQRCRFAGNDIITIGRYVRVFEENNIIFVGARYDYTRVCRQKS